MLYVFLFFLFDINETVTEWTMASGVKRKFSSSATPSQEEESGRELLQLLPFKRKKKTDWSKCLICQSGSSDEALRKASTDGITTFTDACNQRKDEVFERLWTDLEKMSTMEAQWHGKCYQSYTSKQNLRFAKSTCSASTQALQTKVNNEADVEISGSRSSRSRMAPVDWSLCLFCQKKKHKGCKELLNVRSADACESIRHAVRVRNDESMLLKIQSVDLIAAKAKYHKDCRSKYVSKSNLQYQEKKEEDSEDDLYNKAFEKMVVEVEAGIAAGKAYDMTSLLSWYQSILLESGIETGRSYRSERLKNRLKLHFKNDIVFHKQPDPSKPEIVYSNKISLQDIINAASAVSLETNRTECEFKTAEADPEQEVTMTLYHAAQIIKSDIKKCEGIRTQPLDKDDLCFSKEKEVIPESLYALLCWVISNPNKIQVDDSALSKCVNEADERRIVMIAQDIVHSASHGRVKTPKHVGLAMSVRHITGSKQIITLLNRMGHCSSYDEIEAIDTGLAREILAMSESCGVVVPTNISPGAFVQAACDNNDVNEETLDGKHTTHATTLVLYQSVQFGPRPPPTVHSDHSTKRRSLGSFSPVQEILDCSAHGKRPPVRCFLNKIKENWCGSADPLLSSVKKKDSAWSLLRSSPSILFDVNLPVRNPDQQRIPGWSGFNAEVSQVNAPQTTVGYCPMIPASSTEYSTIYTAMNQVQSMMKVLDQRNTVITFDLAIYMKAKEIQWRFPVEFKDTVVRLGGFHIALNFLAVIGKRFQDSGLEDLLVESGIYGGNTASVLLKGKSYNRGVRAHKLVMEAMLRLLWHSFAKWMLQEVRSSQESLTGVDEDRLMNYFHSCQEAVIDKSKEALQGQFHLLCAEMGELLKLFDTFRKEGRQKSKLFAFWDSYIEMVELLLTFIRAEREGSWPLHLAATMEMTPHFFSMDRVNYSRWLPVYLADMDQLAVTAPEVNKEFCQGSHAVNRSAHTFSQVWTDMALEQSINLDSKSSGGIIGITQNPGALARWFLTSHERAAVTTATKELCGMDDGHRVGSHKEAGSQRLKKDESDVQKVVSTVLDVMTDPFSLENVDDEDCCPLLNIATGVVMPDEKASRLITSVELGRTQMKDFVEKRLNTNEVKFWDPLPHLKIETFASVSKKKQIKTTDEKIVTVNADRDLFGRLLIAANSRSVQLREVLSYELATVPYALAHVDGSLRKATKSALLAELEKHVDVLPRLPVQENASTAFILDGMAIVQMVKAGGVQSFGELAEKYYQLIKSPFQQAGCTRVDVVFDRYDKPFSIKGNERERRGSSSALEIRIIGPSTQVPKQWNKYISNPQNKANLTAFLSNRWCQIAEEQLSDGQQLVLGGGFKECNKAVFVIKGSISPFLPLQSDQEEADTRMILHAHNASQDHDRVVIQSPDTDVAVLSTHFFNSLACEQLWFRTGVKDKLRFIPIHSLVESLGPDICVALPCFHALTGCDSTSGLFGIGKKKAWVNLKRNIALHPGIAKLGDDLPLPSETSRACETFICSLYTSTKMSESSADQLRYWMFCQKKQKSESLPPTTDSLHHHIERSNYQALVWKRSLEAMQALPTPSGNGWEFQDGHLEVLLMSKDPAPKGLLELTVCKCKKSGCKRSDVCPCKANEMTCTEACLCMSGDECENPFRVFIDDYSSEEDDD